MSFPFVLVGNPENHRNITWVDNDNVEAGRRLTDHFISRGCRKIAFIGLSDKYLVVKDRFEGYRRALAESGIEFSEKLVVKGAFMEGKGSAMMEELLSRNVPFTGVIAADDYMAFGAIKVLNKAGFQVPEDVAVAGFNNLKLSEYFSPALTSVDINAFELGARAFQLVHAQIQQKDFNPTHSFVDIEITARESTDHQFICQP
jgi:DNA-binding LacI/PurR family transcriptional regulator